MAITVEQLFRKLSYGELSNLAVAVDATGTIKKERRNQVVHFVNEGLKALHSRFPLLQFEVMLTMTGEPVDYAFPTDALQVLSILTAMGESLEFSTHAVPETIYVVNRSLHIPARVKDSELQVTFQLRHGELTPIAVDADLAQEIVLLDELHGALTAHVAWQMYGSIQTAEAKAAAADNWSKYQTACQNAVNQGLLPGEALPVQKFESRGWV